MSSRDRFKGKRIAVMGLGAHGELIEDIKYLIKAGAWVSIYDLKSEARLKDRLLFLRTIGLANYVCGSIPPEDLLDMDLIILSHEYPRDSAFLQGVTAPVEYPETLFFKHAPPVTLVGVMGSGGTSTVMSLLDPMLDEICKSYGSQKLFVIDPESPSGAVAHLKKVKNGDIVLMRITEQLMPEIHALRISPHVAVFTSVPAGKSYTTDPFEILVYQTYNNFIVASDEVIDAARAGGSLPRAKMLRTKATYLPAQWEFSGRGPHDRANAALALQAARLFKLDDDMAEEAIASWKPLKGRLDPVKKVKGMTWYNDTASETPEATRTSLAAVAEGKNVILIFGGADGGHSYAHLYSDLARTVRSIVLLPGSGTLRERARIRDLEGIVVHSAASIEAAVSWAAEHGEKGHVVLFSPGFPAGGMEGTRKERGERFVRAVRGL